MVSRNFGVPSENAILQLIDAHFPNSHANMELGRGDDCAVFAPGQKLCASSDLFLEDAHFRKSYFSPEDTGYKSLAVNLSDLAAMGAKPVSFLMNLGIPAGLDLPWLGQFFRGMAQLADKFGIMLAGGDISAAEKLHISITIFGQQPENCVFLRRGGIMPGDALFLVGEIGLARLGLLKLEEMGRNAMLQWPAACMSHLRPTPQIDAGLMLARVGHNSRPPALMDLSDGLAADLPRLLRPTRGASTLGASLAISSSMLHQEVLADAAQTGADAALNAFLGGEDYALLGACAPDILPVLKAAIPGLRPLGEVTRADRIVLNGEDVTGITGFDHFQAHGNERESS